MVTPTLKSNAGDQKVCKKKNLSWLFGADRNIRPSGSLFGITRLCRVVPNSDPWKIRILSYISVLEGLELPYIGPSGQGLEPDLVQLKKNMKSMDSDLTKVKRMAVFH